MEEWRTRNGSKKVGSGEKWTRRLRSSRDKHDILEFTP